MNELNIGQLRQLASQLDDTCAELKYEVSRQLSERKTRATHSITLANIPIPLLYCLSCFNVIQSNKRSHRKKNSFKQL